MTTAEPKANLSWREIVENVAAYAGRDLCIDAHGKHWRGPIITVLTHPRGMLREIRLVLDWLSYRQDFGEEGSRRWHLAHPADNPVIFMIADMYRHELVPCLLDDSLALTGCGLGTARILRPGDNLLRPNS